MERVDVGRLGLGWFEGNSGMGLGWNWDLRGEEFCGD